MVKKASKKKVSKKKVAKKTAAKRTRNSGSVTPGLPDKIAGASIDDLPPAVREQLKAGIRTGISELVEKHLPKPGNDPVSTNDLIVMLWLNERTVAKRGSVQAALQNLVQKGKAKRVGMGSYTAA